MDFSGSDVVGELKLTGYPKRWGSRQSILTYNIRQYMSYKVQEIQSKPCIPFCAAQRELVSIGRLPLHTLNLHIASET
jgi:hypothetical protein